MANKIVSKKVSKKVNKKVSKKVSKKVNKKVSKKVSKKVVVEKRVDVYYCLSCGGIVFKVVADRVEYVEEYRCLDSDGFCEYSDTSVYDSETRYINCLEHNDVSVDNMVLSESVFKYIYPALAKNGVVKCTLSEKEILTKEDLLEILL